MARAASDISRNGEVIPRARNRTITRAREPAMIPLTDGHTPALRHSQNTNTVTATAEKMTAPSLILRE